MATAENTRRQTAATGVAAAAFAVTVAMAFLMGTLPQMACVAAATAGCLVTLGCSFVARSGDRYRVLRHSGDVDLGGISASLPNGYDLHQFAMTSRDGEPRLAGYVTCPIADKMIVMNSYQVDMQGNYQAPGSVAEFAGYLAKEDPGMPPVGPDVPDGERVAALAGDVSPIMLATGRKIPLLAATRRDALMTDEAFDKVVATTGISGSIVFDGCSLSLSEFGALMPVSQTGTANIVTAHTVIVSSDGYLGFMRGTRSDPAHYHMLVPSASCPIPVRYAGKRTLQDVVLGAVNDEVRRQWGVEDEVPVGSSLVGMARIVERNGATEFYALTRVGMSMGHLLKAKRDDRIVPADGMMNPWLGGVHDAEECAERLARTAYTVLDSSVNDMSVSLAALLGAVFDALADDDMRHRIMRRMGYEAGAQDMQQDAVSEIAQAEMMESASMAAVGNTRPTSVEEILASHGNTGRIEAQGRSDG